MSATFAAAAGRLAGLCGRALGWRPHEFWACTPAELAVILLPAGDAGAPPLNGAELARLMEQEND